MSKTDFITKVIYTNYSIIYNLKRGLMVKQSVPVGVKIIAVLYYISVFFVLISGYILTFKPNFVIEMSPQLKALRPKLLIAFGILLLAIGILNFFVGYGLWKGKKWARTTAIVFGILGAIGAIIPLFLQNVSRGIISIILNLLINSLIAVYLLFDKKAKDAFA